MPTRVTKVALQADVSDLVRGFRASANEARSLNRDVSSLERELDRLGKSESKPKIALEDAEAKARLEEIQQRLTDLGRTTADARVDIDDAQAQTKLSRIEAQLLAIGKQSVDPEIDLQGIAAAESKLGILQAELDHIDGQTATANIRIDGTTTATKSMGMLGASIITLGPAAVSASGVAGGAILGIGAAATTAGVAFGVLGVTIAGQLKSMHDQQKTIETTAKHLATLTQGTVEYKQQQQLLIAQQQAFNQQFGAAATAVGRLKDAWKNYLTEVGQGGVNQVIADAANLAAQILPRIEGMVTAAAGSVDDLLTSLMRFGRGPEAGAMLSFFSREGPAAISAFGGILGDVGKGLVSLLIAFTPLAHGMAGWLQDIAAGFARWAANLPDTQGFQDFMDYVNRVGPKVWDTLGSVAEAMLAISTAAAPVGEVTLPIIKALADSLAMIANSPAGPVLVAAAVGLTAVGRAVALVKAVETSKMAVGISAIGTSAQNAGAKALAAKAGFVAAGIGLEVLASHLDKTHQDLKDFSTILGGAAIGAAGGPWGVAIGAAAGALAVFTQHSQDAAEAQKALNTQAQNVAATLNQQTGAITKSTIGSITQQLSDPAMMNAAKGLRVSLDTLTAGALGDATAIDRVHASYDQAVASAKKLETGVISSGLAYSNNGLEVHASTQEIDLNTGAVQKAKDTYGPMVDLVDAYSAAIKRQHDLIRVQNIQSGAYYAALAGGVQNVHGMGGAYDEFGNAIKGVGDKEATAAAHTRDMTAAQRDLTAALAAAQGFLSKQSAWDSYNSAVQAATASLKTNGQTLDTTTAKGLANSQSINAVASSIQNIESGLKGQNLRDYQKKMLPIFTQIQVGFGKSQVAAENYARKVLGLPAIKPKVDNKDANDHLKDTQDKTDHLGDPHNQPVVKPTADTAGALADIERFSRDVAGSLHSIPNEYVSIALNAQASKVAAQLGSVDGHARGGAIHGPGTATSDSILARLSDGERVQPTEVINKAGGGSNAKGQAVMAAIERMILRGELGKFGDVPAFRDGGAVGSLGIVPAPSLSGLTASISEIRREFDAITASLSAALSGRANDYYTHLPTQGQLGPGGNLTPAQIVRGQNAASSQVGKPYIWGGVGPNGYDCSGFQSYTLNSALGFGNPYYRRGSTGTMPWSGSAPGVGKYTIGWTTNWENSGIGHTSGNIGGLNVESYGGHGPATGSGARSPMDPHFYGHMHYDTGGQLPAKSSGVWHNNLSHAETVTAAEPKYTNALLRSAVEGGADKALVAAMNAVYREVAQLRTQVADGVAVSEKHPERFASGMRSIADDSVAQDRAHHDKLAGMWT